MPRAKKKDWPKALTRAAKVEILGSVLHELEHLAEDKPALKRLLPKPYRGLIQAAQSTCWVWVHELSKADIRAIQAWFDEHDTRREK